MIIEKWFSFLWKMCKYQIIRVRKIMELNQLVYSTTRIMKLMLKTLHINKNACASRLRHRPFACRFLFVWTCQTVKAQIKTNAQYQSITTFIWKQVMKKKCNGKHDNDQHKHVLFHSNWTGFILICRNEIGKDYDANTICNNKYSKHLHTPEAKKDEQFYLYLHELFS